jgi:hypothetical protein
VHNTFPYSIYENNFSSVVAKRLGFLPTTHKLTPHIKGKKCTKKNLHPVATDWVAKEERKENEEEGRNPRCRGSSLGLARRMTGHLAASR